MVMKQTKAKYEYTIGSNVVKDGEVVKYLDIVIWEDVSDDFIEKHIVK